MGFSEDRSKTNKYKVSEVKKRWIQSHYHRAIRASIDIDEAVPEFLNRERIGPRTPEGEVQEDINDYNSKKKSNASLRRRNRRNKLKSLRSLENCCHVTVNNSVKDHSREEGDDKDTELTETVDKNKEMSDNKPRDDVLAARQAKKHAKQKGKTKDSAQPTEAKETKDNKDLNKKDDKTILKPLAPGKDEVDKVYLKVESVSIVDSNKDEEQIKADRTAKKAAKQAKKKGAGEEVPKVDKPITTAPKGDQSNTVNEDMTVKDVVETLKDIVTVAKEIKDVTDKVTALSGDKKTDTKEKAEDDGKSKAALKAERRAKQEAQRAAKQTSQVQKIVQAKIPAITTPIDTPSDDKKVSKPKTLERSKSKSVNSGRVNWFQHLYKELDKDPLNSIPLNSHLHPAIIKLGVQLATRVVTGSNARCIALLDALKKMVRDYTLPAKTEFGRGLESHLAASVEYLWAKRAPSASQTNAVKFFRYHLTQLPNNVDEFDAKKTLQEEIDRYLREQIDMAGEAISITVRNKICNGDNILTYGCSSLIERILKEAWTAGVQFRTVIVGSRVQSGANNMLRALVAHGLPCTYVDITSISSVMRTINKVVLGASGLLANGCVLGSAGAAQVAGLARAHNVPALVACETHKFTPQVLTDAFVYNEIGDPDALIEESDDTSPLKDWRKNLNLTPLNLSYDVTPASLVTAVVTELAILPCTSAPVVLRFKLSEYGI